MTNAIQVTLNPKLQPVHLNILRRYLSESWCFTYREWRVLRRAMNLLGASRLHYQGRCLTFVEFYARFMDVPFAQPFLEELYRQTDVESEGPRLQATRAQTILTWLRDRGLYGPDADAARLLVIFCLARWAAFARGYVFQIAIFRDLEAANVAFEPRDPRDVRQRFADHDLELLGLKGDIKTSTYFVDEPIPPHLDFYITQLHESEQRNYRRVTLVRAEHWPRIDGDVVEVERLLDAPAHFPRAVRLELQGTPWVIAEYEMWKAKLLSIQGGMSWIRM